MDDLIMNDLISMIRQSMLDQIDEMPAFIDPRHGDGVKFIEKTITKMRIELFTPNMSDLSVYIDKLCNAAYERGKKETQAEIKIDTISRQEAYQHGYQLGYYEGKIDGINYCTEQLKEATAKLSDKADGGRK